MITPPLQKKRFEVLDSWRGICAIIVLLGHFQTYIHHSMNFGTVIGDNYYLYVDFFFVLSGFVIAKNYLYKLKDSRSVKNFVFLRFARVYPIHLFILFMFFLLEIVRAYVEGNAMFINQGKSVESLIANLFLLHSMGIIGYNSWNFPSWSISVEFYTYITFALLLMFFTAKRMQFVALIIAAFAPLLLFYCDGVYEADQTFDFGFIRCLGGFFSGVGCFWVFNRYYEGIERFFSKVPVFWESLAIVLVVLVSLNANDTYISYFSPYLFSYCVLIFACELGGISRVLKKPPFLFLGMISYSLYMTHAFVQRVMVSALDIIGRKIGYEVVVLGPSKEDSTDIVKYFDVSLLLAFGLTVVMLVAVVIFSTITYNLIEKPAYKWVKNRVRS